MAKATKAEKAKQKREKTRDRLWPTSATEIFPPRDGTGFARIPRVVPLVARLINEVGGAVNAGPLYITLWAQDWGDGIIEVRSFRGLLFEAGYTGKSSRAERTWRERIAILNRFGFTKTAKNGLDEYGFVLLIDPYLAVARLEAGSTAMDATAATGWSSWMPQFELVCENWGVDLDAYRAQDEQDGNTDNGGE